MQSNLSGTNPQNSSHKLNLIQQDRKGYNSLQRMWGWLPASLLKSLSWCLTNAVNFQVCFPCRGPLGQCQLEEFRFSDCWIIITWCVDLCECVDMISYLLLIPFLKVLKNNLFNSVSHNFENHNFIFALHFKYCRLFKAVTKLFSFDLPNQCWKRCLVFVTPISTGVQYVFDVFEWSPS